MWKSIYQHCRCPDESKANSPTTPSSNTARKTLQDCHSLQVETKVNAIDLGEIISEPNLSIVNTRTRVESDFEHGSSPFRDSATHRYCCRTEICSINSIYLNIRSSGKVYRWVKGSTITFKVNWDSFRDCPQYARHAADSLVRASEEWNRGDFGVRFEKVTGNKSAVFQLVYSKRHRRDRNRLADAFFPGDSRGKQRLRVYALAFSRKHGCYDWLSNIFCHELGHILGLRHSFAPEREPHKPAVLFGTHNDSSVMNYFDHLSQMCIQETDYTEVRDFYNSRGNYDGFEFVDRVPKCFVA